MKKTTIGVLASLALMAAIPAASQSRSNMGRPQIDVPIILGGETVFDACSSSGVIIGLDPNGDGFLSVRSGPGGKPYNEIDRLYNGNKVFICGRKGPWYAVVYSDNPRNNCGVTTPWPVRQPYTGPCRYGWIHSRYVRIIAG